MLNLTEALVLDACRQYIDDLVASRNTEPRQAHHYEFYLNTGYDRLGFQNSESLRSAARSFVTRGKKGTSKASLNSESRS